MPITVIEPNHGNGLATAMGLWDQFLGGPSSKLKQAQIQEAQQGLKNQQQQYDVTGELRGPNLAAAQSAAQIHAAEASKAMDDEADRKGAIAAYATLSPELASTPTTDMGEKYPLWLQAQRDNGVKNIAAAAKAHNNTTATVFGNLSAPKGAIDTGFQSAGGEIQNAGSIYNPAQLPNLDNIFGAPAAPATAPTAPAVPPGAAGALGVTPPAVQAPGVAPTPSQAPGQAQAGQLPNLSQLARISANPFARAVAENALKMQSEIMGAQEKQQGLEKGSRDVAFGTPEERKSESEFIRNAAQLSHRLDQFRDVVGKYGNYEYWNPEGAALLKSLPLDVSDNWTKITNPGGVLREGLVHLGKQLQIPLPEHIWDIASVRNGTTLKAIEQTKGVLADYVRQYENMPSTKLPVTGLTPELRNLVGETKFGKPGDIPSESATDSKAAGAPMITSQADAVKNVPAGQSYIYFDPATGKATKQTRGKEPWVQPAGGNTNAHGQLPFTLPPVIPRQAARPR
jgi:hypothetical protein